MAVVFLQKTEIGFEPWVTEGTPETTRLLLDTSTGRSDVAGGFFHIGVDAGDTLFFSMTTNDARTIWRTDGTLATTRPVLSDENGNASLYRYGAAVLDDYAITTGFTGGLTGVYSVDAAGNAEALVPTLVDNSDPFRPTIRGPEALDFVSLGDRVVFRASDTDLLVADKYLYGTDGTAAGTEVIGTYSGNFVNLTFDRDAVLGDKLIYLAPADAGRTLHVTDGTAAGTFQLPVPAGIISPDVMVEANGLVFFTTLSVGGGTRPNPYQVWQTDGTAAGTQKVADLADLYPWPDQIAVGTTRGITFSNVASDGEDVAFLTTYRQRENLDRTVYELFTVESGEAISRGTVGSQFPLEPTATRAVTSLVGVTQGNAILFDKALLVSTLTSVDLDTNIETELLVRDYKVDRVWFVQGEVFSVALLGRFGSNRYTVEVVATDGTAAGTETIGETQISRTGELPDNLIHMDGDRVYFLDSGDGYGVMSSDGTADGTVRISELVNFPLWSIIGTVPDLPALVASAAGELLEGNAGANTIAALGGNDTINGLAGNDILSGNTGDDVLNGGLGNDRLDGGLGTDTASYEDATGTVFVFLNAGFSKGADGHDTLHAIENADGSAFADYLWGSVGANVLSGGAGNDRLKGNGGTDQLFGGAGADILKGDRGTDLLDGGTGADRLLGFAGDDTLLGGAGADFLYGGRDNDQLNGGDGEDVLRGNLGIDVLDGADGADRIYGGGSNDTLIGGAGNDQLFGEGARDRLSGGAGDDVLTGGFGAGVLDGVQDTFVFESSAAGGGGYDRIKDFEDGTDLIDLSAFGFTDFVTDVSTLAQDRTTGLRINFGDGDILFVFDLQKADFDASDVILV